MPAAESELVREQTHLDESRSQLARMRERTAAMDASGAADWVSREYLQSTFELRMRQLADDPTVPLFFGRLDYEATAAGGTAAESFHIGRRHISEPGGEPMVVDWRAPVSLPFYRATAREPMGVDRRRRYGYQHGRLTAFEDEDLTAGGEVAEYSAILEAEIERPRVGPMRDIVATIQPEQDVIVRADVSRSIAVQGAPGTGKTAVGLHRAAYLLYAHRDQLRRQGVLVVGPNDSFLRYIQDVLPALGEIEAAQSTIEALVARTLTERNARWTIRGTDTAEVATLKGDARMAAVLHDAVWSHVGTPTEALVVPHGARRFRVPAYEVEEVVADLRGRGVRYGAARAMLPQALAHRILVKMELAGESPDDRVQAAVARSRPVKAYAATLWPAVDPARLVHRLLADPDTLAAAAGDLLDDHEQQRLRWARPSRSAGTTAWSLADAVLLDEATDVVERTPSLGHIVIDEAQDLSPMMLRAIGRRSATGSLTVLGDLAQATTPWATRSWSDALTHLGKPDAHVEELTRGFRVPGEVIEYAARLLPYTAPDLAPPTSVRRTRGELAVVSTGLRTHVEGALAREGSVGLIVPDALLDEALAALEGLPHAVLGQDVPEDGLHTEFDNRLDVVPASLAKGLEFDHVVLLEPEAVVAGEPDRVTGLRRLYVCLTRAVTSLVVVHEQPLPPELGGLP
ncbi:MAG: AAA family ATPase [Nocardioides sp.]